MFALNLKDDCLQLLESLFYSKVYKWKLAVYPCYLFMALLQFSFLVLLLFHTSQQTFILRALNKLSEYFCYMPAGRPHFTNLVLSQGCGTPPFQF